MTAATLAAFALGASGAEAVSINTKYIGDFKGERVIGFDVKKKNGKKKVKNVIAVVDFECEGGSPGVTGVELDGSFRVRHDGTFGGKASATVVGVDPPAKFTGELKRHHRAAGTLRVHGELDPTGQPKVNCDTGTQGWKAKKDQD